MTGRGISNGIPRKSYLNAILNALAERGGGNAEREMNNIHIIGFLGNDPEMKYLDSGNAVTEFSIADNYRRTNQTTGEIVETVTWFRVHAFGRLAEIANEFLQKGRQAYVQGRLETTAYESKQGNLGVSNDIYASQIVFLGSADNADDVENAPPKRNGKDNRQQRTSRARNNPARADNRDS